MYMIVWGFLRRNEYWAFANLTKTLMRCIFQKSLTVLNLLITVFAFYLKGAYDQIYVLFLILSHLFTNLRNNVAILTNQT